MNDFHYAVVVGINRYPGIGDLAGPRKDANAFKDWLVDPDGGQLPADNVKCAMVDEADEATFVNAHLARPTNNDVDYALQDVAKMVKAALKEDPNAWDRTRLYMYVAGHGFAPQGGEGALFTADAELDALGRNLELPEYRKWCTSCGWFREVIVLADCCRTRLSTASPGSGPRLTICPSPWNGKASTYVIGFGSTLGKPTYESIVSPDSGEDARGYFTAALIDGLRGRAARDPNTGSITHETLSTYVRTVVADTTRLKPHPQAADINGALGTPVIFHTPAAPPKRSVEIVFPANFSGQVHLVKDKDEIAKWQVGERTWKIELDDGLYGVVADEPAVKFADGGLIKVAGEDCHVEL